MNAVINITGAIGNIIDEPEVYTFTNLVADIKSARDAGATSFTFLIDSVGGLVDEGFLMASYIQAMPEPTTSRAIRVFSIANIIYFAADKREADEHGLFMLHQALTQATGNGDDFRRYADELDKVSDRIASYIASRTGLDFPAVRGLMAEDRFIEASEAKRLGFVSVKEKMAIAAIVKTNDKKMSKAIEALNALKAYFTNYTGEDEAEPETEARLEPVNMDLELEDGESIYVESEDGELEGKPTNAPDGTHKLRNGRSITVEGGIVQSVQEAENMDGEDSEKEMLKKQVADLQAELQALNAIKEEYKALESEVMNIKKLVTSTASPLAKHPRYNQAKDNGQPKTEKPYEPKKVGADRLRAQVLKR